MLKKLVASTFHSQNLIHRLRRGTMSQNQKSITSFFSSKTGPSSSSASPFSRLKSPPPSTKSSNVLKEKPPTNNSKAKSAKKSPRNASSTKRTKSEEVTIVEQVKKVVIVEEGEDDAPSSPSSSPIRSGKRKRVQILESDESEGSDTENVVQATGTPSTPQQPPKPIPKRKTAKLSKEFRAKLANRVQTPFVKKCQVPEEASSPEEEMEVTETTPTVTRPSPIASKLSGFNYKKRNVKTESALSNKTLKVDLVKKVESPSPPRSSSKHESPVKETSPVEKPKPKPKPTKSPSTKSTPKGKEKKLKLENKPKVEEKKGSLVSAAGASGFNPFNKNYSPIKDASWQSGEAVPYKALSDSLKAIEGTGGRLDKTLILSNFLRSVCILSPDDLHLCVYLCTNQVAPAYKGVELGVGETVLMRAIAEACGVNVAIQKTKMKTVGDLGLIAESSRTNQKMMFKPKPLTVREVFETFIQITDISGNQGQSQKISLIKKLLVSAQGSEARFIIRSLLGKLRCGLAEQTVLVSLGHATLQTPPGGAVEQAVAGKTLQSSKDGAAEVVKTCFCEYPNLEHIIKMIKEVGVMESIGHCRLTPGVPVKPMLAHPTKGISEVLQRFEGSEFTCEYKYDGERAQVQRDDEGQISVFSRNQENNTTKYPDVIGRMEVCLSRGTESFILDSEVVAWDVEKKQILPFQILTTRKRKDADVNEIKVKVCLFAFDLLYLNGESLIREPFRRRRELLRSAFKEVEGEFIFATAKDCTDTEEIQEFLDESIKGQCEGLMVKTLDKDATYEIAKRSHNWLKVKKDYLEGCGDSLDLVVIGAFQGKGRRSGLYGGFLLACYDPETEHYQAICKIGTGFTDEDLASHHSKLSEHIIESPKSYYTYPESSAPQVWFEPHLVWEVKCADMTISPIYRAAAGLVDPEKGISLRFPRFVREREDKTAEETTSAEQVAELYNKQDNKQGKQTLDEEDY